MIINETLKYEFQDAGPWRSYSLDSQGDNLEELLNNATISEIDEDGGTIRFYSLDEANNKLYDEALEIITQIVYKNTISR